MEPKAPQMWDIVEESILKSFSEKNYFEAMVNLECFDLLAKRFANEWPEELTADVQRKLYTFWERVFAEAPIEELKNSVLAFKFPVELWKRRIEAEKLKV